jgi:SPP1 gp7 family putative phage head morphogenesis protein
VTDWTDLPFAEAVGYLRGLTPMTREAFDELNAAAKTRAFTVSRVAAMDALQGTLDQLAQMIETGGTVREFADRINEVFDANGIGALDPWHMETIFRTDTAAAYGAGRWEQGTDPDLAGELAGWQYVAVMDDRTREEHADLDGQLFPVGEGAEVFPPWDFNCRCDAIWLTPDEASGAGLTASADLPESVRASLGESEFASPALGFDQYQPDLAGVNPAIIEDFTKEVGRQTQ